MRKGQGAMEYLMTYGWALLVIVIVGAALFALGILNPATYQSRRCNGFQYFTYIDHQVDGTGNNITLHLRNGVSDVVIKKLSMAKGTGTTYDNDTAISVLANGVASADNSADQGEEVVMESGIASFPITVGSYDDAVVTVTYNVVNGIQDNTDIATCVGTAA